MAPPEERLPVGFVGLGVLGSAIVPHLLADGYPVVGHDTAPEKIDALAGLGLARAASPREAAERSELVVTCLPSVAALDDVVSGPAGIDKAAHGGAVVLEISTLPVRDKARAREALAATGRVMLDCPVSGNRIQAQRRQLTAFASGDRAACDRVAPVLAAFTRKHHYVGEFGCGMKMKLVGNILNLVHNAVAAEVMALGMKSGLDPGLIHEVISGSASSSAMFEVRGAMMARNDYRHEGMNFSIPLKDARIIAEHAAELACPIPIYQAALQLYYAAVAQGHHDEDAAAVCAAAERAANVRRTEPER
ncbi:MAG: NAD(P)-dependent oxidoreductase [Burkholderiales bacterium]|nr:NAD(P)-dependent oxidoreductase [Burkholderiales bacterium]